MKYLKISILVSLLIFSMGISAKGWVTFYGKKPVNITENIFYICVYWNTFSNESDIDNKIKRFIDEKYKNTKFVCSDVIYKSNINPFLGRRIYLIAFFNNENDRWDYEYSSAENIELFKKNISTDDFILRWKSLRKKMKFKTVLKKLPELLEIKPNYLVPNNYSVLSAGNYYLYFNDFGRLDSFLIRKE